MPASKWRSICYSNYPPVEILGPDDTALKVPCRSPLIIVDAIKPYIENKIVCEIGSACGDIAIRMKKYAKYVFGIEIDRKRAEYSKKRGLDTRLANALDIFPLSENIDVYLMWIYPHVARDIFNMIDRGVVIMSELSNGANKVDYEQEFKIFLELHKEFPNSRMLEIEYNEGKGEGESGIMVLLTVDKGKKTS